MAHPKLPLPPRAAKPSSRRAAPWILAGLVAAGSCAGLGFLAFVVYESPGSGPDVAEEDMAALVRAAQEDAGAVALRQAGCQAAWAFESQALAGAMRAVDPATAPDAARMPAMVVSCHLAGQERTCEQLAHAFADAHDPPPADFSMEVVRVQSGERLCQGVFHPSGVLMRGPEAEERVTLPIPAATSESPDLSRRNREP